MPCCLQSRRLWWQRSCGDASDSACRPVLLHKNPFIAEPSPAQPRQAQQGATGPEPHVGLGIWRVPAAQDEAAGGGTGRSGGATRAAQEQTQRAPASPSGMHARLPLPTLPHANMPMPHARPSPAQPTGSVELGLALPPAHQLRARMSVRRMPCLAAESSSWSRATRAGWL